MNMGNLSYQVDLSSLVPPGDYDFTVQVVGEGISRSGQFSVLDYNVEQQFMNADLNRLTQLAENTEGTLYFPNGVDDLKASLLSDSRFKITQKSNRTIIPLIDWEYLLGIIILALAIEWFLRKYHGLI